MKKGLLVILTLGLTSVWAQQLSVAADVTHVRCYGDDNGSVELIISGGQAPYQINWTHGSNEMAIEGLAKGLYGVLVTDNANQSVFKSITIDGPDAPILITGNSTDISAFGMSDGAVSATVTGGSPFKSMPNLYNLSWSNNVQGVYSQNGLSSGIYVLTVTDRNDCVATKQFKVLASLTTSPFVADKPFKIFPNPSIGEFKVSSEISIVSADLIDLSTGQIVQLNHTVNEVNVSELAPGEYQLMMTTEDGQVSLERIQVVR